MKTKFDTKFMDINEELEELVKTVKEDTVTKEIEIGRVYQEKWWDTDCRVKRRELQKCLKRARKGQSTIAEYRKHTKEYKELCQQKKERKREELTG